MEKTPNIANLANQPDQQLVGAKTMSMFGFGNYGDVAPKTKDYTINGDTTIAEIESDLSGFLEHDLKSKDPLQSNLLVYAMKELYENDSKRYDEIMAMPGINERMAHRPHLKEFLDSRIENLECLKTRDYVFLVPKDKWQIRGRTMLPSRTILPSRYASNITPNLTAILRHPVELNYKKEMGVEDYPQDTKRVYDESWVGKEIEHFPFGKQLLEAEAMIQEKVSDSLMIPESWEAVFGGSISGSDLRRLYGFSLSGMVIGGKLFAEGETGVYWASTRDVFAMMQSDYAYKKPERECLRIDNGSRDARLVPTSWDVGCSVRLVQR